MTAPTPAFRWTERYSVNIAAIDDQHKRLFTIINELNDALAHGEGAAVAEPVLQKLVDYAQVHFAAEEALLEEYKVPATGAHRAEHDKFTQSMAKFRKDFQAGKSGVSVSLMLFLQAWLKEHILVNDKACIGFLHDRGVH